jgi:hypothetical protein
MTIEQLLAVIAFMRVEAEGRTFGVTDKRSRDILRHGFLLALEQVEHFAREVGEMQEKTPTSPRDAT